MANLNILLLSFVKYDRLKTCNFHLQIIFQNLLLSIELDGTMSISDYKNLQANNKLVEKKNKIKVKPSPCKNTCITQKKTMQKCDHDYERKIIVA